MNESNFIHLFLKKQQNTNFPQTLQLFTQIKYHLRKATSSMFMNKPTKKTKHENERKIKYIQPRESCRTINFLNSSLKEKMIPF